MAKEHPTNNRLIGTLLAALVSMTLQQKIHFLSEKIPVAVSETAITNVINCESGGDPASLNYNKNKKGEVWSKDTGYFQINDYYHRKVMASEGLDYDKADDGLIYGFQLIQEHGLKDWSASSYCWNKTA